MNNRLHQYPQKGTPPARAPAFRPLRMAEAGSGGLLGPPFESFVRPTCLQCREARITCDRSSYPCPRCFRLSLPCRLVCHVRKGGKAARRRCSAPGERPQSTIDGGGGGGGGVHAGNSGIQEGGLMQPADPAHLLDLSLGSLDIRGSAQAFLQSFHAAHAAGRVDRGRALRLLRLWRQGSLLAGTDITWGAAASIAGALGIADMDLDESAAVVNWDGPPTARLQRAEATWQRTLHASAELEQSALFHDAGKGGGHGHGPCA